MPGSYARKDKNPLQDWLLTQSEGMMEETTLLSLPEGMRIEQIQITENGLVITVVATTPIRCCRRCTDASPWIHCHYRRSLRDVPGAGRRGQRLLPVRKFSCRNPCRQRKGEARRLRTFVGPWDIMTIRYCQQ